MQSVPYESPISGGLKAGKAIFIQGTVPSGSDSFEVNLKCGKSEGDDIAFQIRPQFSSNCIVLNSQQNGSWGKEEKLELPLKQGSSFDLVIAVNSENYQVYLSGCEVGRFQHRISLERVIALSVAGEVSLTNVVFTESWAGSSIFRQGGSLINLQDGTMTFDEQSSVLNGSWALMGTKYNQSSFQTTTEHSLSNPVQNPSLPYVGPISGGLREGMALYLQGVVHSNADWFGINFKTGQSDIDDIAFHFNPRMGRNVAMNSFRNGGWESEESFSDNPFKKGEAFEMFTVIKSEGYQIYVNGKEQYTFKHRIPLEKVSALNINGDVSVNLFGFIQNWSTSSFPTEVTTNIISLGSSRGERSTVQSEILQPVQNPSLPYVGPISGGLREGMALYLQGVVHSNADWFGINFKTGQSDIDDIAFHFNPRMGRNVAMNSFRNGGWESEESFSDNPFKKGEAFEMFTVIKSEGYQIYVNGKEQYTFKHRIPLEKVSALNINGDVSVNLFGFIQNWSTSSFPTEVTTNIISLGSSRGERSTVQSEILQPVQNPSLPYVGPISGGLREGMALYLQGVVHSNADWFGINFKTGQSDIDDIAFHFNPRMGRNVAMNSFRNGGWESEESFSDNPFKKGEAFEMFTVIKSEGYQIYVNGKEQYTFKHRIPLEKVSALNINGDVSVNLFGFIQNWSTSSFPTEVTTNIISLGSSRGERSTVQSEILQPVQNPSLPYVGPISGGLREGMALYLQGVVHSNADWFGINFKTGQSDIDDIAFHFNPRMGRNVAMNSFRNGGWESEESFSDNPFKKGEAFEMFTVIKSEGYQIYVNGKEQYTFKHRIPLEKVSALNINGDVSVNLFGFIQNWSTSSFPTEVTTNIISLGSSRGERSTVQSEILQPVQNPSLPYVGPISGGLREGMALYLQGVVHSNADWFGINFKTGQSDIDDIAFHFNPRMGRNVAMNSFRNGGWESEESFSDNPFKKGEAFEMFTVIKSEGYQIYVNGKEQYTFKHRIPLEKVSALNINGDVSVNLFGFIQNWSTSSFPTEVTTNIISLGSSRGERSTIQSEILQPVQNPSLPYVGPISGGLREGMALYLQGVVHSNADWFGINFKTGQSDIDDIAFHFNPRMGRNVAMNSFRNGGWESEESFSDNPFKKGEAFEMFTVIKSEGYQIYVNGKEQYTFKHRIPLEKVSALNINGDVSVNLFGFIQNWSTSSFPTEVTTNIISLGSSRGERSTVQSEILQPVQNPSLPYVGPISGGLREGMALYLQGVVHSNADWFGINFKTGQSDIDDIAFHFNPRMGRNVAMNSFRNGGWESEESFSDNPFKKGEAFEMFTVIKSEGYQIYVNGKEQYTFKHRIPLEKVSALNINGDVSVNLFGFIQNWSTSSFPTEVTTNIISLGSSRGERSTIQSEILQPVQNPSLPYVGPISGGLREGMALYLQGVVHSNADWFGINFKTGQSDIDDIAFHFNPRMGRNVAMNSFRNGGWESEESFSDNPFKKGEAFEMFTVIKSEGYQIYVNGKEQYTFKHRIPLEKVSALNINGDVSVNLFGFIQNWSTSSFPTEVTTNIISLGSSRGERSTVQSEILQPVQNPSLPYVGPISGGLREGMALYLQGVVHTNADWFGINFKTGQSDTDDIAFHFNPRMDQNVAMNSFRNGGWESTESVSDNPFKKGEAFEMFTVIKSEGYQIYVNGKEQYTFKHRIPVEKVSALNINGDVSVNLFGFIQDWSTSSFVTKVKSKIISLGSSRSECSTVQSEILQQVQNPRLPYVGPISGGLREGMALYLQGVVPINADRFRINFKTGQSDTDDTAFHFNPRMDQNVVMNSFRNGKWESEESVSDNPFKKGEAFEMFTVIKSEGYQIYVNGKEQYTFKHRIPLEKVSALNINGDVSVNLFGFIQDWSTSSFVTKVKSKIISLGSSRGERSTVQSEILQPVQNPRLPYVGPISGGLREGMALYLQGVVPINADRFRINFKTGQSDTDDTAFHFNPRMDQNVVMNSFRNGKWESEESVSDNPFKKGEAFEMFTVIKSEGYQIYVNGKEQYTFKHRIPLEKVSALNINGDVSVNLFGFIQDWSTSSFVTKVKSKIISLGSSRGERSTVQSEILQPVQNPRLPYVGPISGGLREGMALYLQGVVPINADRFRINFKTGQSDTDDTAFHFNPRMDQNVVMNSFRNGKWESEESVSDNPFKKGEAFEMFTVIKSEGYQIYVNGKEQYTFKHRIPLEKVSALNINGDVSVNLFGFIQDWSTSSFVTKVKSKIISLGSSRGERSTVQSEILQPVQNPRLPYVGPISGGLREGMALYLQGVVPINADRFRINFKTGQSDTDDTAFHFNPRMDQNVVMNSFRNGKWESEESVSDNPFKKGEAFEMFTVIKSEGYQIYVNGKEQYTFKHRIPLEKVSALNINGDVSVNLFGFIQDWSTSSFVTKVKSKIISLGSSRGERSTVQSEILQPVQNPRLPYVGPISGGLREGMALYLQGVVPINADRFRINFKTGQSDTDDIAFHFNPRMDQNVAMNSFRNGKWESGESVSDNPFKKGEAFEMFTVIKSEGYQIYVNGKEQYTFKHRIPLEKVSALNINGDVSVNLFGFIQDWSTSSFVTKVKSKIISLGSSRGERSTVQSEILQPVQNPSLPYVGPISGGLREGMALYVQGVVPTNADRFSINFKTGPTDKHDIAFHFNPRMGSKVVMNSLTNGKWGAEESVSDNPFKKGEDFEMFFVIKSEGYQVQIKGQQHGMFKHRIPLEKVTTIHIHGKVTISFLGFVMTVSGS
ncbi:unnamed protein product [Leuciscus chuanchicus]